MVCLWFFFSTFLIQSLSIHLYMHICISIGYLLFVDRLSIWSILLTVWQHKILNIWLDRKRTYFSSSLVSVSLFIIYILYFLKRKIKGFSCSTTCYYFRKFVSSFRPTRSGNLGPSIDTIGNIQIHELTCFKYWVVLSKEYLALLCYGNQVDLFIFMEGPVYSFISIYSREDNTSIVFCWRDFTRSSHSTW